MRNSGNGDLTSQPVKGFMGMQLVSGLLTAAKDLADAECELNEKKVFPVGSLLGNQSQQSPSQR